MLQHIDLTKTLVLDIETVPQYPNYQQVPENWQKLWDKKSVFIRKDDNQTSADIYPRAGIYAEFGKIICISVGFFNRSGNFWQFRIKSFYGDDEKILLEEFATMLNRHFDDPENLLCAHNGKEFDFPYLCRRMIINQIEIPRILNIIGKKPWEVNHLDTMELWKFGDFKNFTSLELLAATLNIPTPKDDIDGSQVWTVYWNDNDLERIKTYCQKDIITVAQLILKFRGEDLMDDHDIIYS
ncbi:MAG: 3'-5' exonuclease [Bacteroidia bacterium]|nr:3'-5' exonuclease [Bacteroidia bacterium]MBP9689887.1 3'-5' exonuclease [Bacteroidia bacterium]